MSQESATVQQDPATSFAANRFPLPNYSVQVGPAAHLTAERERLDSLTFEHFDIRRVGTTLGAELHGIDLCSDLSAEQVAEIREALTAFKVIFFRDQPLTSAQHVRFAKHFGDLEEHPVFPSNTGEQDLVRFEKTPVVAGFENAWHHDVTWRESPSMGAVLHALEIPPVGGDTLFCDMHAAYDGLTQDVKDRIEHLSATHDFMAAFGHTIAESDKADYREKYPEVVHPLVCTHPASGRKHLLISRIFVSGIVGLAEEESTALIDELCRQSDYPEYQCRFAWENDSVAFWDNRAVQHYAASDYWPQVRTMERASIVGPRPTK